MVVASNRTNPFPGLRPFELDEEHLFFGREGQSDELMSRLHHTRFLGVVGTSGSGKSSLVRAGLLPSLYSGFLPGASSSWRIAVLRPGSAPIHNLAAALNDPEVLGVDAAHDEAIIRVALTESTLRRGSLGLVEVTQQARLAPTENLLVVVDQFEELFRYKAQAETTEQGLAAEEEAAAFVKLLLAAVNQRTVPIFVVLTMRSDFLGDCAQFRDLPETLNDSQYLIPRLTREQLRQAIEGPVAVGRATITPRLVNRLLNDTGDNPDQLPILQHALMRTWDYWEDQQTPELPLDLEHYEAIGGMAHALSRHADQIYEGFTDEQYEGLKTDQNRAIAEALFKCLTDRGADNREIRRPTQLKEICAVAHAELNELVEVIEAFRGPRRSFLMPPPAVLLSETTVIDISHESLMRNWQRLKAWVMEEAESATIYRRLAETAALHNEGRAGYLRDPELTIALTWQKEQEPHEVWAQRYAANFEQAINFLTASAQAAKAEAAEKDQARQREVKQLRRFIAAMIILFLVTCGLTGYAFSIRQEALKKAKLAREAEEKAEKRRISSESTRVKSLLESEYKLDALLSSLKLVQLIEQENISLPAYAKIQALAALNDSLHEEGYREINRFTGHQAWIWDTEFGYDNANNEEMILSADDSGEVKIWNLIGEEVSSWHAEEKLRTVHLSPQNNLVTLTSLDSPLITLCDIADKIAPNCSNKLSGHDEGILDLEFSKDGKYFVSGDEFGKIIIWNSKGGKEDEFEAHKELIRRVGFSPDSTLVASASHDGTVKVWSREDPKLVKSMVGHNGNVYDISFNSNGTKIVSASEDETVRVWSLEGADQEGVELQRFTGHVGPVLSVSFHKDDTTIASGGEDGTIRIWDFDKGRSVETALSC